jgi:peptidoglycan/LPS O-acetylase OafA/YrhL
VESMREFRLEQHSLRLQSLRGIAAFCVAVGHGLTVMAGGRIENPEFALRAGNSLLAAGELLFQPNTAVILFYVLSGFVLGETLRRRTASTETRHLIAFGIRRLWRLLPVMWLSIIFAAAIVVTFPHGPFEGAWIWFNRLLEISVTPWTLLTHLLGLSHDVNSVLWSIQIELVMIALLPAMAALSARLTLLGDFLVVLFLCGLSLKAWNVLPFYLLFVYCFYLGVMLPKLLSNSDCARFLGNPYGLIFSLSLLIPIDLLHDLNRLWMPYKFVADALISMHLIAFLMLRPNCRHAPFLDHMR